MFWLIVCWGWLLLVCNTWPVDMVTLGRSTGTGAGACVWVQGVGADVTFCGVGLCSLVLVLCRVHV